MNVLLNTQAFIKTPQVYPAVQYPAGNNIPAVSENPANPYHNRKDTLSLSDGTDCQNPIYKNNPLSFGRTPSLFSPAINIGNAALNGFQSYMTAANNFNFAMLSNAIMQSGIGILLSQQMMISLLSDRLSSMIMLNNQQSPMNMPAFLYNSSNPFIMSAPYPNSMMANLQMNALNNMNIPANAVPSVLNTALSYGTPQTNVAWNASSILSEEMLKITNSTSMPDKAKRREMEYMLFELQDVHENDPTKFKAGITVVGSSQYKAQVEKSLAKIRATPEGRELLKQIEKTGHPVRIKALSKYDEYQYARADDRKRIFAHANGTPNKGCGGTIKFDPSDRSNLYGTNEPAVTLFHELVHTYNYATGTMQKGEQSIFNIKDQEGKIKFSECQALGLEFNAPEIKYPDGSKRVGNPPEFTENAFRKRMGIPLRNRYDEQEVTKYRMEGHKNNKNEKP